MKNIKIIVDNLKCGGCATTINKQLSNINGVKSVSINVDISEVDIDYDGIEVSVLKDKLANFGYPEAGTSTTFQKAKSYVSCAVGKLSE